MLVESGETTAHAQACNKSAAARTVRRATLVSGLSPYTVLMQGKVRKAYKFAERCRSSIRGAAAVCLTGAVFRARISIQVYGALSRPPSVA